MGGGDARRCELRSPIFHRQSTVVDLVVTACARTLEAWLTQAISHDEEVIAMSATRWLIDAARKFHQDAKLASETIFRPVGAPRPRP